MAKKITVATAITTVAAQPVIVARRARHKSRAEAGEELSEFTLFADQNIAMNGAAGAKMIALNMTRFITSSYA